MTDVDDGQLQSEHRASSTDVPVPKVLRWATEALCSEVIVIGYDKNGDFYFASSKANGPDVLWLLKLAERKLMRAVVDDQPDIPDVDREED